MGYREDAIFKCYLREGNIPDWLIPGWPRDEDGDSIDTENLIVIRISEVGIEFCCGGDWQEPRRMLFFAGRVQEIEGEICFPDIEIDEESLRGLEKWLEVVG